MLPVIVIGIGGSGKWVLTDIKNNLIDSYGRIPEKIALLEFDLLVQENVPVERGKFDLKQGKMIPFTLDYDPEHNEFFNFCEDLTPVIDSIKKGGGEYPFIEKWFSKDESKKYMGQIASCSGAGQIRPLSRMSLFLHPEEIHGRIFNAVRSVHAGREPNEIIPVFIVSSLAGGTGCGTFIDFANIVRECFSKIQLANLQYYIFGIFILPQGFLGTIPSDSLNKRFQANCFSAFREMHRFTSTVGQTIQYSDDIKVREEFPLFDIVYLVDGVNIFEQNRRQTPHYIGLCPAISEFIMTYAEGTAPTGSIPNIVVSGIRPWFDTSKSESGEIDIPIYSTFGIHRYILEIKDIEVNFAHRLGNDILRHFIEQPVFAADGAVQTFMKGPTVTSLLTNFFYQIIENPGFVATDKGSLISYMKFNSKEEDIGFPVMKDIPIKAPGDVRAIPFPTFKDQVNKTIDKIIGSKDDLASPGVPERSTHGVLNYYISKHKEKFMVALESSLMQILNNFDRKGALYKTQYFLEALIKTFSAIIEKANDMFNKLRIEDSKNTKLKSINRCEAVIKNDKKYLQLKKEYCNLVQHDLVIEAIKTIARMDEEFCSEILNDVNNWIGTFEEGIKQISISNSEHIKTRQSKRTIKCWSFASNPNDRVENRIYELMKDDSPQNDTERAIQEKIPKVEMESLVNPDKYFVWEFKHAEEIPNSSVHLHCMLPEKFEPLESIKKDPIKWNYNFVNNYLLLGQLEGLNQLTIMDVLTLKGEDFHNIASELAVKSSLLANIGKAEQVKGEGKALNTENFITTIANFSTTEPGKEFADGLRQELEKGGATMDYTLDPYTILQMRISNYLKYFGFTSLSSILETYRNMCKDENFHVFPEETNAVKIESKFKEVLHESPDFLNSKIVNLLSDSALLRAFNFALMRGIIEFAPGTGEYSIEIEEVGGTKSYPLGKNRNEALGFLLSEDNIANKAREKIKKLKEDFNRGINESNIDDAIKELTDFYREIDPSKGSDHAEKDLLKVMKVIIYEEIEDFKILKSKM